MCAGSGGVRKETQRFSRKEEVPRTVIDGYQVGVETSPSAQLAAEPQKGKSTSDVSTPLREPLRPTAGGNEKTEDLGKPGCSAWRQSRQRGDVPEE